MKQLEVKQIYLDLPPVLTENDTVSLDLELSGLREGQLHRPAGKFVSLAACFDGETVYLIEDDDQVQEFLNRISKATFVFHNSVFDLGHLKRWAEITERKNMRDTLLIERIMFSGLYSDFGLNDLVRRYLKCYMPKDVRKQFSDHEGRMTQEQIEYAAGDVVGTWLVDKEQQKIISEKDMKIWNGLYNPHVWTTLDLGGFYLNQDCWKELTAHYQETVDRISAELGQKYGTTVKKMTGRGKNKVEVEEFVPYNPSSIPQTMAILRSQGLDIESTDEKTLSHFAEESEFIQSLLEYRKAKKQVSTYGLDFLEYVEADSRIYTSLNVGLAVSGRDSSSSPNLQNVPSDKPRRKCFTAGEGKILCLYDYSGQEPNLWSHFSGDDKIAEIVNSGKKLYIEMARESLHEEITKAHPRYKKIKSAILGMFYGLTPYGYSKNEDVPLEEAEEIFNAIYEAFPKTKAYIDKMQSKNPGTVKSVLGRTMHIHPYDRAWKNDVLNFPMQSSGSDMIKIAMKKIRQHPFYVENHPKGKLDIILQVHDEIATEVDLDIAEEWSVIMKEIMIGVAEQMHPGIKGNVSGGLMQDWSEKD